MEVGAAAAATTAGVGAGLFSYNKGNYGFDQKQHYTRFTAGMNMAIAQTGLYKQDIAQLTELTVSRQDCYHGIAAMGLTILTAIYCPGRVGLHEPPPPGWLMGLEFANIGGCYLFLGLALWYAMHASMRADTAATHMLTRFVRLPIPNQAMLDKARKFMSSYEEQPLGEVFRVPFTKHQYGDKKGKKSEKGDCPMDAEARGRTRHGLDVPAWYKKERVVDNGRTSETIESMMPLSAQGDGPEHFEAYRELQMEWFPFDVYARLSIFLAFMHLIHCWTYLQIGYLFQEVRAMWACAIVVFPMVVLQQCILTLDIIPQGFPVHRIGPLGLLVAYFAAFIEYQRWFNADVQKLGFVLVYVAYFIHIIYTVALYRLCMPSDEIPAVAERPGASWWPGEWRLPSAFQHAIWLVAPPTQLEQGQVDIVGELRAAQRDPVPAAEAKGAAEAAKRKDVHMAMGKQGESSAWMGVRVGLLAMLTAWIWLTFGFTIEIMNQGTAHPSLLSAPGMPNNARDPRYRPAKVGSTEPVEVGTGGVVHGPAVGVHSEAVHRRLSLLESSIASTTSAVEKARLAGKVREVLPVLEDIARSGALVADQSVMGTPNSQQLEWPAMFEPETIVCNSDRIMALSRFGRGAIVKSDSSTTEAFALRGIAGAGAILASSFDEELKVLTAAGAVLRCAPSSGKWSCQKSTEALVPLGANFAGSAAITETAEGLRVAVSYPGEDSVTIFAQTAKSWLPVGEVRTPAGAQPTSFTAAGEALLLQNTDGSISSLNMSDGEISEVAASQGRFEDHFWKAACPTTTGFARLAVASASRAVEDVAAKLVLA